MKYIFDIPFYSLKINNFLDTLLLVGWHTNNRRSGSNSLTTVYVGKVERFTFYYNLLKSITLLELAIQKNNFLYGSKVIIEQTMDYLIKVK